MKVNRKKKFDPNRIFNKRKPGPYKVPLWFGPDKYIYAKANWSPQDFSIWRGLEDGNGLEGSEMQDYRSLAINEIDFSALTLDNFIAPSIKERIGYPEQVLVKMRRQKRILADAQIGQALLKEKNQATLERIYAETKKPYVFLFGTILRHQYAYEDAGPAEQLALYLVRYNSAGFISIGSDGWSMGAQPMKKYSKLYRDSYHALSFPVDFIGK